MKDDSRPSRFMASPSSFIVHPSSFLLLTEPAFPRGEGYYYNLVNLVALLVLYFCWVRTSAWIDEDARLLHIPAVPWNPLIWLLAWFWISFAVLLVLYLAPSLAYASVRNHHVAEEERVLNEHHFRRLAERYLRIKSAERRTKRDEGPAIQFIGRSVGQAEDDPARVERAVHSKGYKTAAALVHQAIRFRATELHLEPNREEMNIRFGIDGLIHPGDPLKRAMGEAVVHILKILGALDLTEKRKPQEGAFPLRWKNAGLIFDCSAPAA